MVLLTEEHKLCYKARHYLIFSIVRVVIFLRSKSSPQTTPKYLYNAGKRKRQS